MRNGNISGEKRSVLLNRTYELFGFGCYYAWFLSILVGGSYFGDDISSSWAYAVRISFSIGLCIGYLVLFLFHKRVLFARITDEKILGAGIAGSTGTFLVAFLPSQTVFLSVVVTAALLAGCGNAFLMMAGGEYWSSSRPERAMLQLATSVTAAIALFYLIACFQPPVRRILIALLPLMCAVILATSERKEHRRGALEPLRNLFGSRLETRFMASIVLVALSFGIILGLTLSEGADGPSGTESIVLLGAAIASVFALWRALKTIETRFLFVIMKASPPCLVLGCMVMQTQSASLPLLGEAVFIAGFVLYDEFLWLLNSELIHRTQAPASAVLPRFEMVEWAGISIGLVIGFLTALGILLPDGGRTVLYLVCGGLVAFTFLTVFSESTAVRLIEIRRQMDGRGSLESRCQNIADAYNLTKREYDVLLYLARGRSLPYIQKELCIAQGTVKSHVRHIYDKIDVSSKQDLIDMIESSDPRPRP